MVTIFLSKSVVFEVQHNICREFVFSTSWNREISVAREDWPTYIHYTVNTVYIYGCIIHIRVLTCTGKHHTIYMSGYSDAQGSIIQYTYTGAQMHRKALNIPCALNTPAKYKENISSGCFCSGGYLQIGFHTFDHFFSGIGNGYREQCQDIVLYRRPCSMNYFIVKRWQSIKHILINIMNHFGYETPQTISLHYFLSATSQYWRQMDAISFSQLHLSTGGSEMQFHSLSCISVLETDGRNLILSAASQYWRQWDAISFPAAASQYWRQWDAISFPAAASQYWRQWDAISFFLLTLKRPDT